MSRKTQRRLRDGRGLGRLDESGYTSGELYAGLSIQCRSCSNQIIVIGRFMDPRLDDGKPWVDYATESGLLTYAGPIADPDAVLSCDCGRCGTGDQRVRTTRVRDAVDELLARCRQTGKPDTETFVL